MWEFFIVLIIVLLAFGSLEFLVFGSTLEETKTFGDALLKQFAGSSLGDVDIEGASTTHRTLGPIIRSTFVLVAVLLLLNLLIAVMTEVSMLGLLAEEKCM